MNSYGTIGDGARIGALSTGSGEMVVGTAIGQQNTYGQPEGRG